MTILSIIISAFNVEKHISVTLNSLLHQSDQEFEILIVNDGSTDNTLKVIEEIMVKSNFNDYKIIDQHNGGVSSARNRGLVESKGRYLYFLDGDDYISYDLVKIVKKCINDENPDIIAWGFDTVKEDKSVLSQYFDIYSNDKYKMTGIEALKNILCENRKLWICTCSAIYRKELIIKSNLSYTIGCFNGEDQEFTFKALSEAKKVCFINDILFFYVQRVGSISNSYNIKKFDAVNAINRATNHIKNINLEVCDIVQYLEYQYILDTFFNNFNSCVEYLCEKNISIIHTIRGLMNDINKMYPGLYFNIIEKIKVANNIGLKARIKYKLFLLSPIIYVFAIRFKYTFKKCKKVMS